MKDKLRALFSFILLFAPRVATVQRFGEFTYTSEGAAITITPYTDPGCVVTIPDNSGESVNLTLRRLSIYSNT